MSRAKIWGMFGGSVVGASAVVTLMVSALGDPMPRIRSKEWRAAEEEYRIKQQMDPIGLGGRKAWDPPFLKKL